MIKHTRTTVGTKPLAAIVAEFAATIGGPVETVPPGEGWIESVELAKELGINRWTLGVRLREGVKAGTVERAMGSKMRAHGRATSAVYYRIKPKPAK